MRLNHNKATSRYNRHHAILILTRLHVSSNLEAGEVWLDARLNIMAEHTAKSIAEQTRPADGWIVFTGPETPQWAHERLREIIQPLEGQVSQLLRPFGKPAVTDAVDCFLWDRDIRPEWLVTMKLDSDDAIAPNFLHETERQAQWEHRTLINHADGFELDLRTGEAWACTRQCNEFAGMVERTGYAFDPPITIFATNDPDKLYNFASPQAINGGARWLKTLHDGNCIQKAHRGGTTVELQEGKPWPSI